MRYLSVCSGIEAASVAWGPLGWKPVGFSEIEPFPCELLAHRFGSNLPGEPLSRNGVPNFGDMSKFREWPDVSIDLLVGGTPCQAFSIAGLRKGLDDPRGNLTLTYLALVERYRPERIVWENVPGVLSIDGGRAFASFLGGLAKLGYGWAYRVLDAQFCRVDGHPHAVPQRRRRVFVVGHSSGDPRRAAAVLLEPEGLRGGSPPRREAGQGSAETIGGGPDGSRIAGNVSSKWAKGTGGPVGDEAYNLVAHALRADGFDASEDGSGRGTPLVPIASPALGATNPTAIAHPYTLAIRGRGDNHDLEFRQDGTANAILTPNGGRAGIGVGAIADGWAVRRLTPLECERLQGFPDGWTAIPRKNGKPAADGPRYKALGNSMAVNVMRWIGRRIELARELS
ncbi:MAG: DNA cytosine methyltransferase [Methylobacterium sp.]|nr:DNA cytosine methyltransferase [Methylobacterium sp.]MCA3653123.1 DNA cytosine methyltransferase [Methylobacterium sp.]